MDIAALALYGAWLVLAFGVRTVLQVRRTGSTGFRGVGPEAGALERLAAALFVAALAAGAAAPALALLDLVEPIAALDGLVAHAIGVALAVAGIFATFVAQMAMGDAWRIGVQPGERTELVTDGPFAFVRNPIFAAMIPTALGLALMVPSAVALLGLLAFVVALELQVRLVEEPYLLRSHGEAYAEYAARVGRFVPGLGLLRGV
ncbi:MAG TPA: isoprenylcysteine carboxylmethyltransferase family protein [Solirubrobacterales bacterium]|nr:isoprenylcysteine carboxylmethyltransferase family protein [Solirubrobacterales bacterium]